MSQLSLILMGAGNSSRFSGEIPVKKQWLRIGELPLWQYVAENLSSQTEFTDVIITATESEVKYMQKQSDFRIVCGGETRQKSLQNAIEHVKTPYVLVSDVARFDVPREIIAALLKRIGEADCIAPALRVNDTVSYGGTYINREELRLIQTPQLSRVDSLREAFKKGEFTDESSAISANGGSVLLLDGSERLKKLTHPHEITLLASFEPPSRRTFIGSGFDVHAFKNGDFLMLGGVKIPASFAFKAHSDGDVVLHALTDAILGAIGAGDIGEWFPDNCAEFKGIDSSILIRKVVDFSRAVGFEINNIDLTIMAQSPKLSPFKLEMEQKIAEILEIPRAKVSLKATTTESLGFVGRNEGIAVQALASLNFLDWTKYACFNR